MAKRSTAPGGIPQLLAVSLPATPPEHPLPATVREVDAIQASTGRLSITRLNDRKASMAAVLEGMKECNWLHLACHGAQNAASPTDGAFMLFDGDLTLKEIMKQSFSHTELAVLLACQTAKGDKELSGEAVHLAAGMLMAGYESVVGTMWSINDNDGPIIAGKFYKYLVEEAGVNSGRAAYAYALTFAMTEVTSVSARLFILYLNDAMLQFFGLPSWFGAQHVEIDR